MPNNLIIPFGLALPMHFDAARDLFYHDPYEQTNFVHGIRTL